ncbi:hypothetical protein BCV70DRAFT_216206 [Testicularia cyperi]|uniref:CCHC-type domain-containing protein n=1 Tax=Testicularia cyperi TaxID=1882483 RepID=A0A317XU77_9BASI|nr:hypothetical protein BCV70DRAFT_216206 [Testicularia cyperi]
MPLARFVKLGSTGHNAAACPTSGTPSWYVDTLAQLKAATATATAAFPSAASILTNHCGQQGHISAQCGMEAQPKTCYKCNEAGHISRECPSNPAPSFGGGSGGDCYKCGQPGHIARSCPTAGGFGGSARGAFGGNSRSCYNCGGVGHISRDCTSAPSAGAGAGAGGAGGYGGQRCYNCNESGHISRECPKPQSKSCYLQKMHVGTDWKLVNPTSLSLLPSSQHAQKCGSGDHLAAACGEIAV